MHTYELDDVSPDMSFLEMLDVLNEQLNAEGEEPIAFDCDCREGICGMCGLMINGEAHGPEVTTTCQLHMRSFTDGDTITIEPWRADAFPVLKDLVRRPRRLRPDHPARRLHLGQHRRRPRRPRHAGAQGQRRPRLRRRHLHRLRRLRRGLPQRLGLAVPRRQDHPPRRAAAGPGRARHPGGQHGRPARRRGLRRLHQHRRVHRRLPQGDPARRDLPAQLGPARRDRHGH